MLIAADVGGTNARLALYERAPSRPVAVATREYDTSAFNGFDDTLATFMREVGARRIDAAAVAVAGPIINQHARLTNVDWDVSGARIGRQLRIDRVRLLNDLEAMACSIEVLLPDELEPLQPGIENPDGNKAIIAAGTGLGEAYLPRIDGRLRVLACEAGHADFAARTERELELVRMLRETFGRASVEHVLSGPGLRNLFLFTHGDAPCPEVPDPSAEDAPARVSTAAMSGGCVSCRDALAMFVEALGAEAGNLGLRGTATGGVYIGGGIAPKILPALGAPSFLSAFTSKAPMEALVERMPVNVILNADAGLLGAAVVAASLQA